MKIQSVILAMSLSKVLATGCAKGVAKNNSIFEKEILEAQKIWGEAIVAIGKAYTQKEDHKALAEKIVETLYGYDEGRVLFKPTKASEKQFRLTKEEAISYFVTGNVPEDRGFAIQPWRKVRFENAEIIINGGSAIAMGNYYFTDANTGKEAKVEFTFGYFKDASGNLRINVHHSSFPYKPAH